MKRAITVLLVALAVFSIPAASFSYGLSATGESILDSPYGGMGLDVELQCFNEPYFNIGTEVVLSPYFENVYIYASTSPWSTLKNPFSFMMTNASLYNPGIRFGGEYSLSTGWSLKGELSLISIRDVSYRYEFLVPALTYNLSSKAFGWGMTLLRFSYVF